MATKRRTLLAGGVWLTICAFAAKAVGALYRLPLTNLLGAKGMAGYQLVFPVYAFVLAATSSAMPILLARQIAKDGRFGYAVFRKSIDLMALLGGVGAAFLLAWAYPFAKWQGWAEMTGGYAMMAPAVLAVALAAPFRGWMQANMHWGTLAGFSMCEQVLKLSGLGFAFLFRAYSVAAMTIAAIGGVALAEIAALLYCVVCYRGLGYRFGSAPVVVAATPIWYSSVPITTANLIMPSVQFVNSLFLVNVCVWAGADREVAMASYGILTGAVGTLTTLPVVLSLSFATLVVPVVSRALHERNWRKIKKGSADTLFVVMALCLPFALGMALLAEDVVAFLYPRLGAQHQQQAVLLLRIGCIGIPFSALQQLYAVLLQSVDRSRTVAKQTALGGLGQVALGLSIAPFWGMTGAMVAAVGGSVVIAAWHAFTYRRLTGRYALARPVAICLAAGALMAGVVWACKILFADFPLRVVWIVLLAAVVYAILIWALGGLRWLGRTAEEKT